MKVLWQFGILLRNIIGKQRIERHLDAELRGYVEMLTDEKVAAGLPKAEARRLAMVEVGGVTQVKQAVRDGRAGSGFESFYQDLRYGMRTLKKSPGFACVAVLTLGLGIGACTAVFSLVNAVLLRALPYGDASRLVYVYMPNPKFKDVPVEAFDPSNADFSDLQRQNHSFESMTDFEQASMSLSAQQSSQRVGVARVDEGFFSALRSNPELGRAIDAGDQIPGRDDVVVISHGMWQGMFGGGPDVLTKSVRLDGRPYRVVGVMGMEFGYPHAYDLVAGINTIKSTEVWIPLALTPQRRAERDDSHGYTLARRRRA
jgi:MacB-like periplasmic core domain